MQAKFEALFRRLCNFGEIHDPRKFRSEGDGIYCFKSQRFRLVCFFDTDQVVITHGYVKGGEKMPKVQKERALRIRNEHLEREARK